MTSKLQAHPQGEVATVFISHGTNDSAHVFALYLLTKSRLYDDDGNSRDSFSVICQSISSNIQDTWVSEEKYLPDVFTDEDEAVRFIEAAANGNVTPCTLSDIAIDWLSEA